MVSLSKKIKLFLRVIIFAVILLFPSSRPVFAECTGGGSCFQACPSGFEPGSGSCLIDVPGLLSQPGVCCKQKISECEANGNECAFTCEENNQLSGLGEKGCASYQVCCKKGNPSAADLSNQSTPSTAATSTSSRGDSTSSGLVPCNTNCTLCHLVVGFKRIFDFFIKTLFVATMLAITVSGVFYMVSTGNKKIIEMAKTGLTYSLMAFVIGMGAWIIINTIMIGLGFKHPYGGNWWEFTCDTSKSVGPVSSGTSPNWGTGKGCDGVAQNAMAMNGWSYTQGAGRMSDGSADCSSMVFRSYQAAGCNLPQNSSQGYAAMSNGIGDPSSLRVGDVIAYPGHVVVCLDNGCSRVMNANTANGIHQSNGSSYYSRNDAGVIRASDYCPGC